MILIPLIFAFLALDLRSAGRAAVTARPWISLALVALGVYFLVQPYVFLLALDYAWGSTPEQDREFALLFLASVAAPGVVCPLCAWVGRNGPGAHRALRLAAAVSFAVLLLGVGWGFRCGRAGCECPRRSPDAAQPVISPGDGKWA